MSQIEHDEPSLHWERYDNDAEAERCARTKAYADQCAEAASIEAILAKPLKSREIMQRVWWDEVKRRDEANRVAWASGRNRPFPGRLLTDHLS